MLYYDRPPPERDDVQRHPRRLRALVAVGRLPPAAGGHAGSAALSERGRQQSFCSSICCQKLNPEQWAHPLGDLNLPNAVIRGNYLSDTTCLMQVFLKRGESIGKV